MLPTRREQSIFYLNFKKSVQGVNEIVNIEMEGKKFQIER